MPKPYHPKYYASPRSGGQTFSWKNPRTGQVVLCRGLEWYVDFVDSAGERRRRKAHKGVCTCPTRKAGLCVHEQMAVTMLAQVMASPGEVMDIAPSQCIAGHDLVAFFDGYLADLESSPEHSDSYVAGCRRSFTEFKAFCVARHVSYVEQVDRALLRDFRAAVQARTHHPGRMRKSGTINRYIREVSAALTRAVQNEWLQNNPAAYRGRNDRITLAVKDEEPITILKDAELAILLALTVEDLKLLFRVNAQAMIDMMTIFYHCGLRKGEVVNLTFAQIRDGYIQIEPHHHWKPKWGICRNVPMTPEVEAIIERRRAAATPGAEYIFSTTTGIRFGDRNLGRDFEKLFSKYKIVGDTGAGVSPHSFRHTFATTCLNNGVPVTTVKDWMGHSRVAMTMKYYHKIASKTDQLIRRVAFVASAASAGMAGVTATT